MAYEAKAAQKADKPKRLRFDDDDFLAMVRAERQNALGLDQGDDLTDDRTRALDYFKGDMSEIPTMPNRSKAVHTVVSDTLNQALPDLIEIFLGGEEVGAFRPLSERDEDAAKQETEVVNNVIKNDNDGFGIIHDYVHDALLMKAGVFHAWIERKEKYDEKTEERQTALAVQALQAAEKGGEIQIIETKKTGNDPMLGPLYTVSYSETSTAACVHIETAPPEDFATARDTVKQSEATYSVMRQRPRAQKLKQMGFDPDMVDDLPTWNGAQDTAIELARDTAGEHSQPIAQSSLALNDLRSVLIYVHAIRVDADGDGVPEIWRVITDERESVLLDKEKLEAWPFCVGTPFRIPHRPYGRSLADLCIELQRIMTALLRLHLDGGFFALNARHEVDMSKANESTLADYMNNTPGMPVRVKQGGALTPLISSKSDFNALDSLEYMATVGEGRHGIARNAQGLNPDTLHDTASGAQELMTNAQKRLRLIARMLAETGLKDLFLLVHTLLRTSGADQPIAQRIRGKWIQVDPTDWGERKDFDVEIGMGAGGRQMDIQAGNALANLLDKIVQAQGQGALPGPPIVTSQNAFSFVDWFRERLGIKRTTFVTDPQSEEGQQLAAQQQQAAQQPNPKVIEAQSKAQLAQQDQAHQQDMERQRESRADFIAQSEQQRKDGEAQQTLQRKHDEAALADDLKRRQAEADAELAAQKAAAEDALAHRKQDAQEKLAVRQQNIDYRLKIRGQNIDREVGHAGIAASHEVGMAGVEAKAEIAADRPGGRLDE